MLRRGIDPPAGAAADVHSVSRTPQIHCRPFCVGRNHDGDRWDMDKDNVKEFLNFTGKVVIVHTVTYFVFGLLMASLFDYGRLYQQEIIRDFVRPIDSSYMLLGPLVQPIRGLLFAFGLWPIRNTIMENKRGWLILWSLFVVFGILGTPAAAPSSLEGIIYSKLPLWYHLIGLPEIALQTLAFSLILVWWEKRRYQPSQSHHKSALWADVLKAVMIASFAYMGYAVGSILSAVIARVEIDMETAASDLRTQMMFVVAFVVYRPRLSRLEEMDWGQDCSGVRFPILLDS